MSEGLEIAILDEVEGISKKLDESSGGGGGLPVGAQIALSVGGKIKHIDEGDSTWLKTGSMESDIATYNQSVPVPYRFTPPTGIVKYSTVPISGIFSTGKTVFTSATTHWSSLSSVLREYDSKNVATGREIPFTGLYIQWIAYNHITDTIVAVDGSGAVFTVKPDGTEKTEHFVKWNDIWPYGLSTSYCKGFAFDGVNYQFVFTYSRNSESCTQVALDQNFNEVGRKNISFDTGGSTKQYVVCVGADASTGVMFYGISYTYSSTRYWQVYGVGSDGVFIITQQGVNNDTVLGTAPTWVAYNHYTSQLHLRANTAHSSSDFYPFGKAFTNGTVTSIGAIFPNTQCVMMTEAGGFGWAIEYSTHKLHKYKLNVATGKPELTGDNYDLTGFTAATYGVCGAGDKLWIPEYKAPYIAHEFALDGTRTGRTLDIPYQCRHLNSDGEFIYAISYGHNPTRIRKYAYDGTFVEEISDHDFPANYAAANMAFSDGVWIDRMAAYVTGYYTRDFKYIGLERYETSATYRPSQPYAFFALGLLMFASGTSVYGYKRKGKTLQLGVGDPIAKFQSYSAGPIGNTANSVAGVPLYQKIKGK